MIKNFFLGCNSANGFYSLFSELYKNGISRIIILKGGPGTGKSTVMKRILSVAEKNNYTAEKIFCSSDPDSLDAIIIKELKIAVADGTAPHILEPKYPGVIEDTVNLGECWDKNILLKNKSEIINNIDLNKEYHNRCTEYLFNADRIKKQNYIILRKYININKSNEFTDKYNGNISDKKFRLITAITPKGVLTLDNNYENVIYLNDRLKCVSELILNKISKNSIEATVCPDYVNPKNINSIIFENGILTVNNISPVYKNIDCSDFYYDIPDNKTDKVLKNIEEINENTKIASDYSYKAKIIHDKIENYYIRAMNFDKINNIADNLIKSIF